MTISGSLRAASSDYPYAKPPVGRDLPVPLCRTKSLGCGKPSRAWDTRTQGGGCLLHPTISWPAEDSAFISNPTTFRNPRSSPWAEPLQEFSGKQCEAPCPVPLLGMLPVVLLHSSFLWWLSWVRALACLCSSSLISPALPKTLFCLGHPQARSELLCLRTALCLVPIAAGLHSHCCCFDGAYYKTEAL